MFRNDNLSPEMKLQNSSFVLQRKTQLWQRPNKPLFYINLDQKLIFEGQLLMFPVYTDICGAKFVLFYGKSGIPRTVLSKDFRNALESIDFGNRFQRDSIDFWHYKVAAHSGSKKSFYKIR